MSALSPTIAAIRDAIAVPVAANDVFVVETLFAAWQEALAELTRIKLAIEVEADKPCEDIGVQGGKTCLQFFEPADYEDNLCRRCMCEQLLRDFPR